MAPKQLELLASLRKEHRPLRDTLDQLAAQYEGKLWHQVTQTLEKVFEVAEAQTPQLGQPLIQLYDDFIADFAGKLNLLKLSQLAVKVSKHYPDLNQRLEFLEKVLENLKALRHVKIEEPSLYLKMHVAENKLLMGDSSACKQMMEEGKEKLEAASDVGLVSWKPMCMVLRV